MANKISKISFIGGGNMSSAIIAGLLKRNYPINSLCISEPNGDRQSYLKKEYPGINITGDNNAAIQGSDTIVLGIKPNIVKKVMTQDFTATILRQKSMILSLVAGVKWDTLARWINPKDPLAIPLVRCMPNTPSIVSCGALGLYTKSFSAESPQRSSVERVLASITHPSGMVWVNEESQMDAITAISGSGPAYFFYMIEAMEKEGSKLGLTSMDARKLAAVTAYGAAKLVLQEIEKNNGEQITPEELRRRVTSPNGTTHAAIEKFKEQNFETVVSKSLQACYSRSKEIGDEMDRL